MTSEKFAPVSTPMVPSVPAALSEARWVVESVIFANAPVKSDWFCVSRWKEYIALSGRVGITPTLTEACASPESSPVDPVASFLSCW